MQPKSLLLPVVFLAACEMSPPPEQDACGASGYSSLVGRPLAAVTLPADLNARIIGPDTVVTMDYNPERLNIRLDETGTIVAVDCG